MGGGVIAAVGIEFLLYATGISNELLATAISRILITVIGAYVGKWAAEAKIFRLCVIPLMLIPFFVIRIFRILFVEESFAEEVMYLVKNANMFFIFAFVLGFSIVCKYVPSVIKKFLEWLGGASLEIYLIHNFIGAVYHGLNVSQNVLIYFLLIVPFSVVIAKLYRHTVVALEKKH